MLSTSAHGTARRPAAEVTPAAILGCAATVLILTFQIWGSWTGLIESDDQNYAEAAQVWVSHGPALADHHWGLRYTIVLPLAVIFRIFGTGEVQLESVATLYTLALLMLCFFAAAGAAGVWAGVFAVLAVGSVPMIAGSASLLYSDVPEAVFVLGSVAAFAAGWNRKGVGHLIMSGVLAGLAAVTRETTVCLLIFYGLLFVCGYGGQRSRYLWIVPGFLLVTGIDTISLWIASGDPLYRLHTTLRGIAADNPDLPGRMAVHDGLTPGGQFGVSRLVGAPLMMLVNQAIGPILWVAIPASVLVGARLVDLRGARLPGLLALLALIWFVLLSWVFRSLFLIPRYQTVAVVAMSVPLGICLAGAMATSWRWPALAALGCVMAGNFVLSGLSDRNILFSERQLARIVRDQPGIVHTDPATFNGAHWLLADDGTDGRVTTTPPAAGDLYVFNTHSRRPLGTDWPIQNPLPEWEAVARYIEPPRPLVTTLDRVGLLPLLPLVVQRKLTPPPRETTLYRVRPVAERQR